MKKLISIALLAGLVMSTTVMLSAETNETDRLIAALTAENIGWRVDAARLLGEAGNTDAIQPLISVLKNDTEISARISAAVALTKIGDASALKALENASKNDKSLTVRTVSAGAFKELKSTTSIIAVN